MAGASSASNTGADPLIWESFLWGLVSASSLNIGSIIGVTCLPSQKFRAILMAFGGGALLFALTVELFGHVLHKYEEKRETAAVWVMEGSAVFGGILFAGLNRALNSQGADVRKPSTTKGRMARLRALFMRRLTLRLSKVPFFSVLSFDELKDLVQSAMYKERFNGGDVIVNKSQDAGIYFIISGLVRLQVSDDDRVEDSEELLYTWDLGPNQIFGDMTVLTGSHIGISVEALKTTKVLVLPRHEVSQLFLTHPAVRDQASLRAVERLREVKELRHLPNHALAKISARCSYAKFEPGETIFHGTVDNSTAVICVVLGTVERTWHETGAKRILHASCLLCTEKVKGKDSRPFTAVSVGQTSVLYINRSDLDEALTMSPKRWPNSVPTAWDNEPKRLGPNLNGTSTGEVTIVTTHAWKRNSNDENGACKELASSSKGKMFPPQIIVECLEPDSPRSLKKSDTDFCPVATPMSQDQVRSLGQQLGWNTSVGEYFDEEQVPTSRGGSKQNDMSEPDPVCHVTDQELEFAGTQDALVDAVSARPSTCLSAHSVVPDRQSISREGPRMLPSRRVSKQRVIQQSPSNNSQRGSAKESVTTDVEAAVEEPVKAPPPSNHAAIMVWLGILIDAVPESLVIGILVNKSAAGDSGSASFALPFVISVFLSNLPEAMSASGSMKNHGIPVSVILLMWVMTTIVTAIGAIIGSVVFPPAKIKDPDTELIVSGVEGVAAGAMLTMIAQTMMPEAFEQGGDIVGLSCLAGFLCSMSVKMIPT